MLKASYTGVNYVDAQAKVATVDNLCAQAGCAQPCKVTHHQAKEADIHAVSELKRALDKKVYNFSCAKMNTFVQFFWNLFNFCFHVCL